MKVFYQKLSFWLIHDAPRVHDAAWMSFFVFFITLTPYWTGEINLFEVGIYLPGIDSILEGKIPYRDFFHLRGPLELYVPSFLMILFGEHVLVLNSYFYVGTVATLIIFVLIAKEVYKTRFIFYLMIPVLVARTFPRVVFYIWGGMRYALGALSILFFIYFLKKRKIFFVFLSGIITSLSFLTSAEIGVCSTLAIFISFSFSVFFRLESRNFLKKAFIFYLLGLTVILLPYGIYLVSTQSLLPFLDCVYSVAANMTKTFPDYLYEPHPRSFTEAFAGMSPFNPHFQHLTPAYCYIFFILWMGLKLRKHAFTVRDLSLMAIFGYGVVMYVLAFRKIGAAQFEMALQPEKLLLFSMLEGVSLFLIQKKEYLKKFPGPTSSFSSRKVHLNRIFLINFLLLTLCISSFLYVVKRYDKRFFMYKYVKNRVLGRDVAGLMPLAEQPSQALTIDRVRNMTVPDVQAEDLNQIAKFISEKTTKRDIIFMFPEHGTYNFIFDRPFVGRFPIVTFSWINQQWADELLADLKAIRPRYAILPKKLDRVFNKVYFKIQSNRKNFDNVMAFIDENYQLDQDCELSYIYRIREE